MLNHNLFKLVFVETANVFPIVFHEYISGVVSIPVEIIVDADGNATISGATLIVDSEGNAVLSGATLTVDADGNAMVA